MRKPCCENIETTKGAWSKQEDQKLIDYIQKHGQGSWNSLPKAAGLLRCGKSCRLRWKNYLRPDLKHGSFGEDEEDLIIRLHSLLGNRWSLIAGRLPGRTDNEVKNYWNCHIKKKLRVKACSTTLAHHRRPQNYHVHVPLPDNDAAAAAGSDQVHDIHMNHDDPTVDSSSKPDDLNLDLTLSLAR